MRKSILCLLSWSLPFLVLAQSNTSTQSMVTKQGSPATEGKGIHWTTDLSWQQIKQKAKAENKYIFIDAYTTWCGPCKMMDKYVYPNDTVGDFFNTHYIAVKIQMDETANDDQKIKEWYSDADAIKKEFLIEGYPCLIFLSPDAKILQKEEGYTPVEKLISIGKETLSPGKVYIDPYKEYKSLVSEYKQGLKHYDKMPYMIMTAQKLNDADLVKDLFRDHLDYISALKVSDRYTQENIEVWSSFILKLDSKALPFFLNDGDKIDQVMNQKGYASRIVDRIIQRRIVDSFFKMQKGYTKTITGDKVENSKIMFLKLPVRKDGKIEPDFVEADWKVLEKMIRIHFKKDYVQRNVLTARMRWYTMHQNMAGATKMYFIQLDKWPPENLDLEINQVAWHTFLYVNDKRVLKKSAMWMKKLIEQKPGRHELLDTYANLLYKLGRTAKAIEWEEKALIATNQINERKMKTYENVISQMKKGEPTYIDEGAIWLKN